MKLFVLTVCIFIFYSCSPTGSGDTENPLKPTMVARSDSSDLYQVERGIDAIESNESINKNDIVIMWHKHPETVNLEKYIVYRGQEISQQIVFSRIQDVQANFGLDTLFMDNNVTPGIMYYYFIIASDQNNNRSVPSDTVKYQLLEVPILEDLRIANSLDNPGSLTFKTLPFTPGASAGSILRIEESGTRNLVYIEYIKEFENADGIARHVIGETTILQSLFNDEDDGYIYEWRIDLADNFSLYRGSESDWQEFSINWGN